MPAHTRTARRQTNSAVSRRTLIGGTLGGALPEPQAQAGARGNHEGELLEFCRLVQSLGTEPVTDASDAWDAALSQASYLPARTALGLRAKARLLLALTPAGSRGGRPVTASPEEQLLWSLLQDVLRIADGAA